MKQLFFIGIVSASILVASACARGQSNVYSVAIYSAGHSWADLCSLTLPFPPYHYKMTEHGWREDANGLEIIDFNRRNEKGSVARRSLGVECGTNSFRIALEPANVKRAKADRISLGNSGSGDFALLVTSCITNRGGHTMAPSVPLLDAAPHFS